MEKIPGNFFHFFWFFFPCCLGIYSSQLILSSQFVWISSANFSVVQFVILIQIKHVVLKRFQTQSPNGVRNMNDSSLNSKRVLCNCSKKKTTPFRAGESGRVWRRELEVKGSEGRAFPLTEIDFLKISTALLNYGRVVSFGGVEKKVWFITLLASAINQTANNNRLRMFFFKNFVY